MRQQGRLMSHFRDSSKAKQGSQWNELWISGQQDLWDRGHASPALVDYLHSPECLIPSPHDSHGPIRALVPGCGTGYDPVMLAQHGFEAWGLEYSAEAVRIAKEHALVAKAGSEAGPYGRQATARAVNFIQGDFFSYEWQASLPFEPTQFDLVYDYTFLCALLPESRKDWAKRMAELVQPGKFLVCLEFPLWKDNELPGPPWGMSGVYWNLLAEGGDGLSTSIGGGDAGEGKGAFDRVQYLKPATSYPQGRGTDMISVWRRKTSYEI